MLDQDCDVMGLTETWLTGKMCDAVPVGEMCAILQSYSAISVPHKGRTRGGVAIGVQKHWSPSGTSPNNTAHLNI